MGIKIFLGLEFCKHFFLPYNTKLLFFNIKKITPSWIGRFVPQTDIESILKGALFKNEEKDVGYNSQFYYPKKGGIQFLINQLTKN